MDVASGAGVALVVLAGIVVWLSRPPDRLPVAIIPAVNVTGYADLDPLRLALSHALTAALVDSKTVRVIGHEQLLSVVRRFRAQGKDLASGEALQAVRDHTGVPVLVVMSLVNDGGGFKARLEFREDGGLSPSQTYETAGEVSTIVNEAAYQLLRPAAEAIEEFGARRSRRAQVAGVVRAALGTGFVPGFPHEGWMPSHVRAGSRCLRGARVHRGAARLRGSRHADPLNPLPLAWESRVARIMRQEIEAERLGRQAVSLSPSKCPRASGCSCWPLPRSRGATRRRRWMPTPR